MATVALVAASDFNADQFRKMDARGAFDAVVAVDAGFASISAIGREPDLALGDFDSLGFVPSCARVERFPAHKDKSDLELAFDWAFERGFERACVFGALGGRLDHTVANLQLFCRFSEAGMQVAGIGDAWALRVLAGPATLHLPAFTHGTVSVFAATDKAEGVVERGMEYAFDGDVLSNRTTRGLSNELTGAPASVSVERGTLYVFHPLAEGGAPQGAASV